MAEPLRIRFATDHSAAKSGMQDLAASVVANMIKVSDALDDGIKANGGYAATFKTLATSVGKDALNVANAGLSTAANTNLSIVATAGAIGKAAAETKTAGVAMNVAAGAARAQASFAFAVVRNEATQTMRMLASSPLVVGSVVGLAAAVAGYQFVTSAIEQANAQIEKFIALGNNASRAGVGVEFWQRFLEGAKSAKLEVAEVEAMLKSAGKAVTPRFEEEDPIKKRLSELFDSGYLGNYEGEGISQYRAAGNNEERIRAALQAMRELMNLGDRLAAIDLGEKLFGSETAELLRSGRLDIEAMAAALDRQRDDLVKQEEVDRAQEFRDRLDTAYKTINDFFLVSVALEGSGRAILDTWLGIVEGIAQATKNLGTFYNKVQDVQAEGAKGFFGKLFGDKAGAVAGVLAADYFGTIKDATVAMAGITQEGLRDQAYGTRTLYDKPIGPEMPPAPAGTITNAPMPPRRPLDMVLNPEKYGIGVKPTGSKGSEGGTDAVETFINSLEKSVAGLKAETEAFSKSNAEKAAAINLAKLRETAEQQGITLTEAQIAKTKAASEAVATYKDKLQDLEQQERQTADAARHFGNTLSDALGDAILEGKGLQNILLDVSKMMVRSGLQAMMTGQGPLAGLLGTAPAASQGGNAVGGLAGMFASVFRANGGPVSAGRPYTVGEMGQEIFVPDSNGRVMPISRGGFGGMGGPAFQIIDQRTMAAPAPEVRRGPGGSMQILLRDLEGGIGQRAARGQGAFAGAVSGPDRRKG
ncbi:hypothetical protein ASF53_02025 [Methylobacterium sp. Leaf123]|uniref:hypothetical protein n=1 Tax=Methylobacterium sp. Leaf123 TaxID=1736264 RepID=UPI0006FF3FE4|nr:hypothetical protein [Methylobacterium sp. Leaf123]KQQ31500.1 hypothetical protein ASF53_02025 [Methylobacterium sp. Leaf123]